MDEVEKQKAIADLDNMFRDEEDGVYKSDDSTSPSSQLHHVSTNAANAGAAAADEDALLKHDISPTSCLGGDRVGLDDTSSHVGTVDDNANQDDLNNSITAQELRAAAKKEKRKRYGLYALIGVLGVIVVALAISLGVGAKKGEDYASQYSNAFNNAEDGNQGPPPGLVDESSYYGDGSPPPGVVVDSTSEGSIVENIPEEEPGSIVDIAAGNEDFSTLVAAVTAAGLLDALSGEGPITVFGKSCLHLMGCYHVHIICTHISYVYMTKPQPMKHLLHSPPEQSKRFSYQRTVTNLLIFSSIMLLVRILPLPHRYCHFRTAMLKHSMEIPYQLPYLQMMMEASW